MSMFWTHLDIREKHLEHVRAWVAGIEKHELGLLQMIWGETFLDLKTAGIKENDSSLRGENIKNQLLHQANTDIATN